MDFESFQQSIKGNKTPREDISLPLQALWWDRKGEWEKAHDICQKAGNRDGDWVHAYLHRVEGDEGNASYWYSRCEKPFFFGNVVDEWEAIARSLLGEK